MKALMRSMVAAGFPTPQSPSPPSKAYLVHYPGESVWSDREDTGISEISRRSLHNRYSVLISVFFAFALVTLPVSEAAGMDIPESACPSPSFVSLDFTFSGFKKQILKMNSFFFMSCQKCTEGIFVYVVKSILPPWSRIVNYTLRTHFMNINNLWPRHFILYFLNPLIAI